MIALVVANKFSYSEYSYSTLSSVTSRECDITCCGARTLILIAVQLPHISRAYRLQPRNGSKIAELFLVCGSV